MEYVEGISAAAAMRRLGGRLPIGDALHIALKCAQALRYAHANRIVHRDVKPENVMITRLGHIKITDLGLAKPLSEDSALTESGTTLGTPKYMAPEQARDAKRADHRSDLYALGGVLYHFVTGAPPFTADTVLELQVAKEQGHFQPVRSLNPESPARLDLILQMLLNWDRPSALPKRRRADPRPGKPGPVRAASQLQPLAGIRAGPGRSRPRRPCRNPAGPRSDRGHHSGAGSAGGKRHAEQPQCR